MERTIYNELVKWKIRRDRKPMMLYGARQVGKTYILKEFGKREFENTVYINCYKNDAVRQLFAGDTDVSRLLLGIAAIGGQPVNPQTTLIILDEAQELPEVVAALKYFCEDAPEYCIAVAGSLLGVMNMSGYSFPTGKVEILRMYPMTFTEFLLAQNQKEKVSLLGRTDARDVVNSISSAYIELLRQYYYVGGMPEAVLSFVKSKDPIAVRKIQNDILEAYESDIAKHAGSDTQKARMIFQAVPRQLAKENKKFAFNSLKKAGRYSEFSNALQWLVDAGLVYKVERVSKAALPLSFYMESTGFKLFLLDIGLLGAMANVPAELMLISNNIFTEYKGAFTENYVLEQLVVDPQLVIGYYSKGNSSLEIDFIVQSGAEIIPLEVKAETNLRSKSLRQFVTIDNASADMKGIRTSMQGFQDQGWMQNIPLYAIGLALKS